MKFSIHDGFNPQASNPKFFIDWMISFQDMGIISCKF